VLPSFPLHGSVLWVVAAFQRGWLFTFLLYYPTLQIYYIMLIELIIPQSPSSSLGSLTGIRIAIATQS
jgi:hypothetical protein